MAQWLLTLEGVAFHLPSRRRKAALGIAALTIGWAVFHATTTSPLGGTTIAWGTVNLAALALAAGVLSHWSP
jgi:uncharacterized membrane protein